MHILEVQLLERPTDLERSGWATGRRPWRVSHKLPVTRGAVSVLLFGRLVSIRCP